MPLHSSPASHSACFSANRNIYKASSHQPCTICCDDHLFERVCLHVQDAARQAVRESPSVLWPGYNADPQDTSRIELSLKHIDTDTNIQIHPHLQSALSLLMSLSRSADTEPVSYVEVIYYFTKKTVISLVPCLLVKNIHIPWDFLHFFHVGTINLCIF